MQEFFEENNFSPISLLFLCDKTGFFFCFRVDFALPLC